MDGTWLLVDAKLQDQYVVLVNEPYKCRHVLWYLYSLIMQENFVHSLVFQIDNKHGFENLDLCSYVTIFC